METKNKYTKFETLLQEKISKHEMPYDNKEWLDFEKKLNNLPKSSFFPNKFYRFAIFSASVIIPILAILYFIDKYYLSSETPKIQTQISNNTVKSNYSNVTESNNNSKNYINNQSSQNNQYTNKSNTNFIITPTHSISNISVDDKILKIVDDDILKTEENTTINFDNENDKLNNVQFFKEVIFSDVTEGCVPLKVMFKPLIVSDTITYLWNFGDNKTSSQKMPSHIYSGVGVYDVSLEIKFLKSQKTKKFDYPKTITVKETPIAQFSYDINEEDGTCLFTDNSSEAIQWNWVFGDKNMSKDKNPEHVYIADGIYNVQLNVSNASGCSDTSYKKISVKLKEQYSTPNSFSPNGDGLNDFFGPVINENMTSDGFEMNIYNKSGVLVFVTKDINIMWDGRIKGTSSYSEPGVYIWKISMKNKFGINYEKTGFVTLLNF